MGLLDSLIGRLPWTKARKELERQLEETKRRVFALPPAVARAEADRLLANPQRYRCTEAPVSQAVLRAIESLGPSLRQFFSRYESVEEIYGETRLSRHLVGPANNEPSLTKIGEDMEFSEVAAAPGSDEVLLLWGEGPDDEPPERYPSIYHFLLMNAATQERYTPP